MVFKTLGNIPDAIPILYSLLRYGDITIRAALITIFGISLAFPFCSYSIILDTSASLQSSRNIDDSLDLDMYDSNEGNEVMGTSL